jgi:hypothetical protein
VCKKNILFFNRFQNVLKDNWGVELEFEKIESYNTQYGCLFIKLVYNYTHYVISC